MCSYPDNFILGSYVHAYVCARVCVQHNCVNIDTLVDGNHPAKAT